jgi:hypothetical protein
MIREGDRLITNLRVMPDEFVAEGYRRAGWIETVGPREAEIMLRAKNAESAPHLMTGNERERLAARRLVARKLLVQHFPGAGEGHPLRKFYSLTPRGAKCWLLVRGQGR